MSNPLLRWDFGDQLKLLVGGRRTSQSRFLGSFLLALLCSVSGSAAECSRGSLACWLLGCGLGFEPFVAAFSSDCFYADLSRLPYSRLETWFWLLRCVAPFVWPSTSHISKLSRVNPFIWPFFLGYCWFVRVHSLLAGHRLV